MGGEGIENNAYVYLSVDLAIRTSIKSVQNRKGLSGCPFRTYIFFYLNVFQVYCVKNYYFVRFLFF